MAALPSPALATSPDQLQALLLVIDHWLPPSYHQSKRALCGMMLLRRPPPVRTGHYVSVETVGSGMPVGDSPLRLEDYAAVESLCVAICKMDAEAGHDRSSRLEPDELKLSAGQGGPLLRDPLRIQTGRWPKDKKGRLVPVVVLRQNRFAGALLEQKTEHVCVSPDGRYCATLTARNWRKMSINCHALATGKELWTNKSLPMEAVAITFNCASSLLLVAAKDGGLRFISASTGRRVESVFTDQRFGGHLVSATPTPKKSRKTLIYAPDLSCTMVTTTNDPTLWSNNRKRRCDDKNDFSLLITRPDLDIGSGFRFKGLSTDQPALGLRMVAQPLGEASAAPSAVFLTGTSVSVWNMKTGGQLASLSLVGRGFLPLQRRLLSDGVHSRCWLVTTIPTSKGGGHTARSISATGRLGAERRYAPHSAPVAMVNGALLLPRSLSAFDGDEAYVQHMGGLRLTIECLCPNNRHMICTIQNPNHTLQTCVLTLRTAFGDEAINRLFSKNKTCSAAPSSSSSSSSSSST
jgi:hypothetical protein